MTMLYMYLHQHGIPILSSLDPLLVCAYPGYTGRLARGCPYTNPIKLLC